MKFFSAVLALPLALAAPIINAPAGAEIIPNKWIVVMNEDASDSVLASTVSSVTGLLGGAAPRFTYNIGSFKGFSVDAADTSLLQTISNLGSIRYIEPDTMVRVNALTTQQNPPYGLARISHRNKGSNEYVYDDSAGQGIVAYGIDTGIYTQHSDFGGRATFGANFADKNNTDGNGHGTHTAGTLGGTKYGVAKKVSLVAVKVLDASGSGATSQVIAGINWAADDTVKRGKQNKAVGNLSLGGPALGDATSQAAAAAVKKGLFLSVAAGNSMLPALTSSPANEPSVCTVAASDKNDQFASFSNFGSGVDVIAPGVDVLSAWIGNTTATNTISGTSMAAPHVGGLGAYLLALEGPKDPVALCKRIQTLSTKGKISGLQVLLLGTPNNLAFNGATA